MKVNLSEHTAPADMRTNSAAAPTHAKPWALWGRLSLTPVVGSLLVLSTASLFFMSLNRFFDHDEFEAMHTTWKMFQGGEIYTDFIQHHHPFTYYTLLPFYALFGSGTEVLIAARVFFFLQCIGLLALTYLIALETYQDRLTALVGTLFLSVITLFTTKAIEIRPDVPQVLLNLLGAYLVVRFFRTRATWLLVASGVALGLSVLFSQKGIVFAGLVGLVLLGRWFFGRDIRFSQGLLFAGSVIAAALPYVFFLLLSGRLESFFFWNFTYNTVYYELRGNEAGKLLKNINNLYSANALLCLLFAVGLFLRKKRLEWELIFLAAGMFGFALLSGRHNLQYYLPILPFVAIVAARGLLTGLTYVQGTRQTRTLLAALVLVFVALPPTVNQFKKAVEDANAPQLARIQYVLNVTDENDYVYDGNIEFNLFRDDIDFIWYMAGEPYKAAETLELLLGYDYNVYEAIERYEPKVISSFGIDDLSDPRIAEHYAPSPDYPELFVRTEP